MGNLPYATSADEAIDHYQTNGFHPDEPPPPVTSQIEPAEYEPTNVVESTPTNGNKQPVKNSYKPDKPHWQRDADGNWHSEPVNRYMYGKSVIITPGTGDREGQYKVEYGGIRSPHVVAWFDEFQCDDFVRSWAVLKSE